MNNLQIVLIGIVLGVYGYLKFPLTRVLIRDMWNKCVCKKESE